MNSESQYPSGEPIHAGDKILFGGNPARIVIVTQIDEYAEDFPKTEWAFLSGDTIAVRYDDGRLMMYDSFCAHDEITLLERGLST